MDYPDISLYELIRRTAVKLPTAPAYSYFGKVRTYQDFITDINNCAKALKAVGINQGDVVTICMPNTPEAITAFYGINQVGAVANMLHPLSGPNEILNYIQTSRSKAVFILDMAWGKVQKELKANKNLISIVLSVSSSMPLHIALCFKFTKGRHIPKPEYEGSVMSWKTFVKHGESFTGELGSGLKATDPAVILYSGGTTGIPKGILLSNLNFNAVAILSIEACVTVKEGDVFFSVMPIFHGFGLGICFHAAFYIGGKAMIIPSFSAAEFGKLLMKHKPNVLVGVPTLYEALITRVKDESLDLSFVKVAVSGGDTLPPKLKYEVDRFLESHNCQADLREGYGLTECTTACCLMPPGEYREGSIGKPFPDVEFKIVEPETENERAAGTDGEIVIKAPMMMMGYFEDEEETRKHIRRHADGSNWLHSGDIGSIDEEGFVYFRQRLKRVIVTSGYNVYPQSIEKVVQSHPDVFTCAVIGIDHPYKKQVPKAFVVLREGNIKMEAEIRQEIMELCEQNLAKFAWPFQLEFREELPKTLVGKVAYQTLAEEEKKQLDGGCNAGIL